MSVPDREQQAPAGYTVGAGQPRSHGIHGSCSSSTWPETKESPDGRPPSCHRAWPVRAHESADTRLRSMGSDVNRAYERGCDGCAPSSTAPARSRPRPPPPSSSPASSLLAPGWWFSRRPPPESPTGHQGRRTARGQPPRRAHRPGGGVIQCTTRTGDGIQASSRGRPRGITAHPTQGWVTQQVQVRNLLMNLEDYAVVPSS